MNEYAIGSDVYYAHPELRWKELAGQSAVVRYDDPSIKIEADPLYWHVFGREPFKGQCELKTVSDRRKERKKEWKKIKDMLDEDRDRIEQEERQEIKRHKTV